MDRYYVYVYKDPLDNDRIIYVGKGSANRAYVHLRSSLYNDTPFYDRLKELHKLGVKPIVEILKNEMNEEDAYSYEKEIIEQIGLENLYNVSVGGVGNKGTDRKVVCRRCGYIDSIKMMKRDHYYECRF